MNLKKKCNRYFRSGLNINFFWKCFK